MDRVLLRPQVVNLHYLVSKMQVKSRPSVLWCYKKDLYLSSHRKKRMNQIRKMVQRGLLDPEKEDPLSLFMASTQIRYCYYKDTHKILGNTFGMCVLQDFEALTPNLLARTIETVEGGGVIVLLLSKMDSLQSLYTMTMDVHARFRTESQQVGHAAIHGSMDIDVFYDKAVPASRVSFFLSLSLSLFSFISFSSSSSSSSSSSCCPRTSRGASTSASSCRWPPTPP